MFVINLFVFFSYPTTYFSSSSLHRSVAEGWGRGLASWSRKEAGAKKFSIILETTRVDLHRPKMLIIQFHTLSL